MAFIRVLCSTLSPNAVFASAVMVVGKLLFGFILGSIASTLANLETQKVQYEEKLTAIKASTPYACTAQMLTPQAAHTNGRLD